MEDPRQSPRPAPLVNSGEWQSFEVRMRRRRVERLIVRAEIALAEGNTDEVSKALAEMRALDPALPQIAALEEKLAHANTHPAAAAVIPAPPIEIAELEPEPFVPERLVPEPFVPDPFVPEIAEPEIEQPAVVARRDHPFLIAAASLIMAAAGAGMYWVYRAPEPDEAAVSSAAPPAFVTASPANAGTPAAPPATAPVLGDSADIQVETVQAATVQTLPEPQPERQQAPPPAPEPHEMPQPANDAPTQRALPAATSGVTVPLAQSTTEIEPPPAVPDLRRDVPVEARNVSPAPIPEPRSVPKPERTNPEPMPVRASEDAAVRGILDRYADAYSRLDASAAQEIWPAVNRSALSRAFDGLASQQVSLERCDVAVHGVTARAICDGSATWAPKVGNGVARTEPRNWTFQLAKAGADWQIVSARVQQPQNK